MPKMLMDVTFSLAGMIRADKDTDSFVAYCPALDLYSAGKTRMDAKKAIQQAVDTYIRVCYDRGMLGRLLKQKGFASTERTPPLTALPGAPENYISISEVELKAQYDDVFNLQVPLHLVAAAAKAQAGVECLQ